MRLLAYSTGFFIMTYPLHLHGMSLLAGLAIWALCVASTSEKMAAVVLRFGLYAILTAAFMLVK